MPEPLRVGVLASGRGSNFRALVEATQAGRIPATMVVLISDRETAPALDIARAQGIEALFLDPAVSEPRGPREGHHLCPGGATGRSRLSRGIHADPHSRLRRPLPRTR